MKCLECDKPAVYYDAGDMECGRVELYDPHCEDHGWSLDYVYCLVCRGHLDGFGSVEESSTCFNCKCDPDKALDVIAACSVRR